MLSSSLLFSPTKAPHKRSLRYTLLLPNPTALISRVSRKHLIRAFYQNTNSLGSGPTPEHSVTQSSTLCGVNTFIHCSIKMQNLSLTPFNSQWVMISCTNRWLSSLTCVQFHDSNGLVLSSRKLNSNIRVPERPKRKVKKIGERKEKPKSQNVYYFCKYLWRP